ncbi:MAG TPA: cation-translocating P-type ATPase C-terminal domain-containing protein, partial [Candidatus Limnocylindria bacterium]|nr:cation-translocating P-type ATPase C-terminal domain-containing protein [Candidatus Limnocylindria bacterium]
FATMVIGQLLLVIVERSDGYGALRTGLRGNRVIAPILVGAAGALVLVEAVPPIAALLHVATPTLDGWLVAFAVAGATTLWGELVSLLRAGARAGLR